jgi:hypothetical protein
VTAEIEPVAGLMDRATQAADIAVALEDRDGSRRVRRARARSEPAGPAPRITTCIASFAGEFMDAPPASFFASAPGHGIVDAGKHVGHDESDSEQLDRANDAAQERHGVPGQVLAQQRRALLL